MGIFRKISEKTVFEQYYNLYSDWFDDKNVEANNINTRKLVELIKKNYEVMDEKKLKFEIISLKERLLITMDDKIQNSFYNLCLNVLNECKRAKINEAKKEDEGFLVELSNWLFGVLDQISIFNVIIKLKKNASYRFVDLWVAGNLIASIICSIIVYNLSIRNKSYIYAIVTYSLLRIFEVIIYQINVLFFHPYRSRKAGKKYKIKSVTRMVIALLHNYIEIMFWYSTMVIAMITLNGDNAYKLTWIEYIRSNILCIATLDAGEMKESIQSSYKYLTNLIFLELISGIIMTVISLARFIGILPAVDSLED